MLAEGGFKAPKVLNIKGRRGSGGRRGEREEGNWVRGEEKLHTIL